jgi:hypothetical protein
LVTFCWQHCECVNVNCGEILAQRLEFQQSSMKKAVETEVVSDVISVWLWWTVNHRSMRLHLTCDVTMYQCNNVPLLELLAANAVSTETLLNISAYRNISN